MTEMILDPIDISLTAAELQKRLRLQDKQAARGLIEKAMPLMAPKAAYRICYVEEKAVDSVVVERVEFTSRVLRRNLSDVGRVFAFVLTLGDALEGHVEACEDLLQKYYLDEIGNMALRKARIKLERHLRKRYGLDKVACMSPGSLPDWPIEQQKDLFRLLGGIAAAAGVRLTESMLMLPRKSVSGVYFPSEVSFFSCQLCPRERCEGRKAPYDAALARDYGILEDSPDDAS